MPNERKPIRANDYDPKQSALVRSACLDVATRLQDFKEEVCIVGGLVPGLAFLSRGENKDAYDLYYVVRGREDTTERLRSLLDDGNTVQAIEVIREDFTDPERIGPRRVAEFLTGGSDDDVQADVAGVMRALLTDLEGT